MNLVRLMRNSIITKQIIVASQSQALYTTKRLLIEGKKLNLKTQYLNPYEHSISIEPLKNERKKLRPLDANTLYFHRTTGINYDDFDLVASADFEAKKMKITNPLDALKLFRTKDQQALYFQNKQLSFIPTIVFRGNLNDDLIYSIKSLSLKSQKFILKMSRGNGGIGVNYVEGLKSLLSLLETFKALGDQKMLIQPFIPHQKEWRLFVIKNEIVACIEKKIATSDFRGNSKKSQGKFIKKPSGSLLDLAHQAFLPSGLDYAGLDIIQNSASGELLLCEVNAIPGFEQVEELSKINIARELITHI